MPTTVRLKATTQGGLENASNFTVGLIRTSETSGAGELILSHPVARWEVSKKNVQDIDEVTDCGMITIEGNITAGTPSVGTLKFTLPPVSMADLKHYSPGEPVGSVNDTRSIKVICSPGYAELVSVYFSGEIAGGNRAILKTSNESIGVIIKEGGTALFAGEMPPRWHFACRLRGTRYPGDGLLHPPERYYPGR